MTATTTADLLDPSSPAYKKARRQFYKATKNRPPVEQDWSSFRAAEKRFKARFPPPDLSTVLDLALLVPSRSEELDAGVWKGSSAPFEYVKLSATPAYTGPVYIVPAVPGAQASACRLQYIKSLSRTRDPSVVSRCS